MSSLLEFRKIKRTGLFPAFVIGGLLAAVVPVLNLLLQSGQDLTRVEPLGKLLVENWQMMTMLNTLLMIAGASLLYSIEYSDHALEKMRALPIKEHSLFLNKVLLLTVLLAMVLLLEMVMIAITANHWFTVHDGFVLELVKNFGYFFLMNLPAIFLSLLVASLFENIWVTLGINVTAVFLATMIYPKGFLLSLFPFALPFQLLQGTQQDLYRIIAAIIEVIILVLIEMLIIRFRRDAE